MDSPEVEPAPPTAPRQGPERLRAWLFWWWPAEPAPDIVPPPEPLDLRDGTRMWLRPLTPHDRELHAAAYRRLSQESKYHRFLTPMPELSEELLERLVDGVDGVDHIAYYAFADDQESALPVAIGRIVRDPQRAATADIAVTVEDKWQGRGVGTALVRLLVQRRPPGVTHLLTVVAEDNPASLAMLRGLGPNTVTPIGDGVYEVRVNLVGPEIPDAEPELQVPAASEWRALLRDRDRLCPWLP